MNFFPNENWKLFFRCWIFDDLCCMIKFSSGQRVVIFFLTDLLYFFSIALWFVFIFYFLYFFFLFLKKLSNAKERTRLCHIRRIKNELIFFTNSTLVTTRDGEIHKTNLNLFFSCVFRISFWHKIQVYWAVNCVVSQHIGCLCFANQFFSSKKEPILSVSHSVLRFSFSPQSKSEWSPTNVKKRCE